MAKKRTYPAVDDLMPSLFDDSPAPSPEVSFPGMERHIRLLKKEQEKREASVKPLEVTKTPEHVYFMAMGSGSSGNCAYVGTRSAGVLIDAGVDTDKVEGELKRNGIPMTAVQGILLTHDHGDHVRYAYNLLRRNRHILLYCTPRVMNGILRRHNISRRIRDYHKAIYKEIPFNLAGFEITAFEVDHDGSDNAGYHITTPQGFAMTIATDLGRIGDRVDHYMRLARHIVIEANYDMPMLLQGSYPEYLKARIMADNGHLDNTVTAAYLASIYTDGLKNIFLCHLSEDNNTPLLAVTAVSRALNAIGVTVGDCSNSPTAREAAVQLMALPRYDSTGLIRLAW